MSPENEPVETGESATMRIALIGALDTKGEEYAFLKDEIEELGHIAVLIDVGVLGDPTLAADVSREAVAESQGASIEHLQQAGERGAGMRVMAGGAAEVVADLVGKGAVGGVLAVGGSNAAYIMARVSEALPVGLPKVLVSTMASGDTRPYVGSTDLTMMNSIVDINGLNRITDPFCAMRSVRWWAWRRSGSVGRAMPDRLMKRRSWRSRCSESPQRVLRSWHSTCRLTQIP